MVSGQKVLAALLSKGWVRSYTHTYVYSLHNYEGPSSLTTESCDVHAKTSGAQCNAKKEQHHCISDLQCTASNAGWLAANAYICAVRKLKIMQPKDTLNPLSCCWLHSSSLNNMFFVHFGAVNWSCNTSTLASHLKKLCYKPHKLVFTTGIADASVIVSVIRTDGRLKNIYQCHKVIGIKL